MKKIISLILLLNLVLVGYPKSQYQKNSHVFYKVKKDNENYLIEFKFMDHIGKLNTMELNLNIDNANKDIKKFGLPKNFMKPYKVTPEVQDRRAKQLKDGLFKLSGNTVEIDYSAVVNYYAPVYCKPIANSLIQNLRSMGLDTRHHRIEIAMKFVQDIPYAIPETYEGKKYTGGAISPAEILVEGYGDCDSKTMLFVGILSYMVNPDDIIFVGVPDHMLSAIKNEPVPGGVYFKYKGDKYYLAETAGPARYAFGEQGKDYKKNAKIHPLKFTRKLEVPPAKDKQTAKANNNKYYYIKIENLCNSNSTYLIRYKDIKGNWIFSDWQTLKKNSISEIYTTQEPVFYIFANSGNIYWMGDEKFSYSGKDYEFKKVDIKSEQSGEYKMRLRCK